MDLNLLDTKTQADEGAVLHLKHPATGELLYENDERKEGAFTLTLFGADSDAFYLNSNKVKDDKTLTDATPAQRNATLCAYMARDCNLVLDGKKVKVADIAEVFKSYPWIVEQAYAFLVNRANFMKA